MERGGLILLLFLLVCSVLIVVIVVDVIVDGDKEKDSNIKLCEENDLKYRLKGIAFGLQEEQCYGNGEVYEIIKGELYKK